jgi:Cu(I)/Ag(I) efflux system membrane fusion protein
MKIKNIILIVVLVVAAGAGWFFLKKPIRSITSAGHEHKDIYYCPMHPHYQSDRPGTCPICYMNLVKKEELKETLSEQTVSGYSTVSMDMQKQQLIGLKTALVTRKNLVKTIHANGHVAHDLDLYEAQLEFIEAWRIYYAFLSRRPITDEFRADWRRYSLQSASQGRWKNIDKLKAQERLLKAEYALRHMGITGAQFEDLRKVKYGQPWVQPDLLFFEEGHPVWIYAQILENDLGFVDIGQKAIVTIPVYGETTEGIVRNVALAIDPDTRTTQVRIELPNYRGELNVNMFVNVDMPVELDASLVVPREAVMDTGLNKIVFVQIKDGIFEPRIIQTGFEGDGMVAVKSGLKEGETIVVSGNFLLDSESRLQGALAGGHNHD